MPDYDWTEGQTRLSAVAILEDFKPPRRGKMHVRPREKFLARRRGLAAFPGFDG
jgi:hypothetical protein